MGEEWEIVKSDISLRATDSKEVGIGEIGEPACFWLSRDEACDLITGLQHWVDYGEFPKPVVELMPDGRA